MVGVEEKVGQPKTRAMAGEGNQIDEAAVLHYYQTDHRMILMRHVVLRDSVYVQTLTEEDMINLHITPEEQAFGEAFVLQLNDLLKRL